ncbi:MAG: hypothetical protein LBC12_03830 [Nitrososphaerota archaeon]|jgi:zinc transporter ZupT|nr:hypothetical protein [Nitrososphaerota archaeon]
MDSRIKIFGVIALVGFIGGIIALLASNYLIPWLRENLPSLSGVTDYLIAGVAGAILAIIFIAIWVRITGNRDRY